MRVAFFQPYLAAWRSEFLARFDRDTVHDVIVIDGGFRSSKAKQTSDSRPQQFRVEKLWSFSPVISYRSQTYPLYFSPFLFFSLVRNRPDCVVTEGEINFLNNISVWLYCLIFGKGYVWWSLGKVRTRRKNVFNKLFDPVVDFLLRRAGVIMARNSYAARYYAEKGCPEKRIVVAPNCMDDERALQEVDADSVQELLEKKGGQRIILYVGALSPEKRPADLIELLVKAREMGVSDIAVWYVGDGSERPRLEELARQHNLESAVVFFGRVLAGAGNYFTAADLVVVPGLGGLVINHAMIFGKPVVSRPADGTEEDLIQNGVNGYIVDSYSTEALLEKTLEVLNSPRIEEMGQAASSVIQTRWNMKRMIEGAERCVQICWESTRSYRKNASRSP